MPFFKDFNKDVKDLISKNYAEHGAWKLESKFKGPEKTIFINPSATHKGLSVDVEYNAKPYKTKTTITDKQAVTSKVSYEQSGHKVEVSVDKDLKYEVVYEGKFGAIVAHDKLTNQVADAYVAYALGDITVGGGGAFSIEKGGLKSFGAGVHYAKGGIVADLVTDSLKSFTAGALTPLTIADQKLTVATQVTFGAKFHAVAGVEGSCPLCKGAKYRVKVDNTFKCAFAWIYKLSDNWKCAISADCCDKKLGLTLTRE